MLEQQGQQPEPIPARDNSYRRVKDLVEVEANAATTERLFAIIDNLIAAEVDLVNQHPELFIDSHSKLAPETLGALPEQTQVLISEKWEERVRLRAWSMRNAKDIDLFLESYSLDGMGFAIALRFASPKALQLGLWHTQVAELAENRLPFLLKKYHMGDGEPPRHDVDALGMVSNTSISYRQLEALTRAFSKIDLGPEYTQVAQAARDARLHDSVEFTEYLFANPTILDNIATEYRVEPDYREISNAEMDQFFSMVHELLEFKRTHPNEPILFGAAAQPLEDQSSEQNPFSVPVDEAAVEHIQYSVPGFLPSARRIEPRINLQTGLPELELYEIDERGYDTGHPPTKVIPLGINDFYDKHIGWTLLFGTPAETQPDPFAHFHNPYRLLQDYRIWKRR